MALLQDYVTSKYTASLTGKYDLYRSETYVFDSRMTSERWMVVIYTWKIIKTKQILNKIWKKPQIYNPTQQSIAELS